MKRAGRWLLRLVDSSILHLVCTSEPRHTEAYSATITSITEAPLGQFRSCSQFLAVPKFARRRMPEKAVPSKSRSSWYRGTGTLQSGMLGTRSGAIVPGFGHATNHAPDIRLTRTPADKYFLSRLLLLLLLKEHALRTPTGTLGTDGHKLVVRTSHYL